MKKSLYDILGLPFDAPQEDIDIAARRLLGVLESRTSLGGLDVQLIAVKEAHQVLSNPQTRAAYDLRIQAQAGAFQSSPLDDFRYNDEPAQSNAFWEAVKPMLMSGRALIALSILIAVCVYSYSIQQHRKAVVTVVERAHMSARDKVELQELRQELGGRLSPEELAAEQERRAEEEKRLELARQQQQFSSNLARFKEEEERTEREKRLERESEQQKQLEREHQEQEQRDLERRELEARQPYRGPRVVK